MGCLLADTVCASLCCLANVLTGATINDRSLNYCSLTMVIVEPPRLVMISPCNFLKLTVLFPSLFKSIPVKMWLKKKKKNCLHQEMLLNQKNLMHHYALFSHPWLRTLTSDLTSILHCLILLRLSPYVPTAPQHKVTHPILPLVWWPCHVTSCRLLHRVFFGFFTRSWQQPPVEASSLARHSASSASSVPFLA